MKHRALNASAIIFFNDFSRIPFPKAKLKELYGKIAGSEKRLGTASVHVIFCSDYKIRKLNAAYRAKDRPTDVLSFTFGDKDLLGEIYISAQRAAIQARRYGCTYSQEIQRLFVHGIFHLLGYDHHTPAQARRMQSRERRFCVLIT